ncbi:hypothetical protein AVEN_222956-1 [Araneus ventricosus]|uniref:Uncharacterized protein n=1 Tax=Araneus ventricosus TaxID=182803 RepID=A0A4Y2FYV8_ARAVE|nr:hypothetical protein AVEN_222956-1 [Araneus ventricosus]
MTQRKALASEEKLQIISEIDQELKRVVAAKKYGIFQSTIATFLRKKTLDMLLVGWLEFLAQKPDLAMLRQSNRDAIEKGTVDSKLKRFKSS